MATNFIPALIIVDVQEDFCPPNGSLAVAGGRDIVPTINTLLSLPFALKVATKDWHPSDHISFASNHVGKKPFQDFATITNPTNSSEHYETRLWPDHCVQNTPGAELLPELNHSKIDKVVEKGQARDLEMYSAFYPPLVNPRVGDSGLAGLLREQGVTDVFVVGLAFGHCVGSTATDAAGEGFRTVIVEEGTRGLEETEEEKEKVRVGLRDRGVAVVSVDGKEIAQVRNA